MNYVNSQGNSCNNGKCNCPVTACRPTDCSPCSSPPPPPTTEALTTTIQITTTATKTITNSAYSDPDKQKSGLCLDNQGCSPGPIIGAAIGGTIFGSILTAIVFVFIHRRSKNLYKSNKDQTSRTVRNAAYGYTNDNDQLNTMTVPANSAYSEINDGMRKSAVISPIMRQVDSSKIDEVYNHLGESEKEDRSDYYDHAGPAPSLSVMEDGYGVLSMESEGNDNYNTVDGNYSTDCGKSMTLSDKNKQSNDYFILETQNN